MRFKLSLIGSAIVFLLVAGSFFSLRSIPMARIWNNYSVCYVEKSVPEATVLFYLEQAGCRDIISLSAQRIPNVERYPSVDSSYLTKRLDYFHDEGSKYNLYYIPEQYQGEAGKAVQSIVKGTGAPAGLDGKERYPWMVPLVCLITYLILALASKKRGVFMLPGAFPLLLSLSQPFYLVAASVCLILLALYLINGLWIRRKFFSAIFRSIYIDILIVSSLALLFSSSIVTGVLGAEMIIAVIMSFLLMKALHDYKEYRSSFTFLPIFSAWQIPVVYKKTSRFVLGTVLPLTALLVLFFVSTFMTTTSSVQGLSIPTPDISDEGTLPSAEQYYGWVWRNKVFPYRSLNEDTPQTDPKNGERVTISHFEQTDGGIKKSVDTLFTYNDKFRNGLKDEIRKLDYGAIEKLMISQGDGVSVSYGTGAESKSDSQHNGFNMVLLLASLCIPVFLYGIYFGFGRKKYENSK